MTVRVIVLGLNHKVAAVEVRERLAVSLGQLPVVLTALRAASGVSELAILSTCNRFEVYAVVDESRRAEGVGDSSGPPEPGQGAVAGGPLDGAHAGLVGALADLRGIDSADIEPHLYARRDACAADHLCRVAAGLDSLLVGEYQILGQVKTALLAAQRAGTAGHVLSALFRQAIHAGKRARTETEIGLGARSLGEMAISLARQTMGELHGRSALIVGAGKMSELAGRTLAEAGLTCLMIANRTFDRAATLASALGGRAVHFDSLAASLRQADVIIAATGAPHIVLHPADLEAAMAARPDRPLLVIDLAVPRNVDPLARHIPGLLLYDMDDLMTVVASHHPVAASAIAAAETIAAEEAGAFVDWWRQRQAAPVIQALRAQAESVRQVELARTLRRLGPLTLEQETVLQAFSKALVNKLLHTPTCRLKSRASGHAQEDYLAMASDLFALADPATTG